MTETLHTCPDCGARGLLARGLTAHRGSRHCQRRAAARASGSSLPAPISPLSPMSKKSSNTSLAAPQTIDIEPAAGAVQIDPWAKARRLVEAATLFQRASLAAQILAGMELLTLHKRWGVKPGRPAKLPHDAVISPGSKPHDVALIPGKWADAVKQQLGISCDTASRWMEMAKAAKPRLAKADLDLGAILEKNPGALTPAEQELLKKAVHKISDGRTQMEFLLECGAVKAPQGSGAKGGNTRATLTSGDDTADQGEGEPTAAEPAAWDPRAEKLNALLMEAMQDGWWNDCAEAARRTLHGNLVDAVSAVAATLKPKA